MGIGLRRVIVTDSSLIGGIKNATGCLGYKNLLVRMKAKVGLKTKRVPNEASDTSSEFPPGYDISTSCGRVYKNRVERPVRDGAIKSKTTGPLELETDTGLKGTIRLLGLLISDPCQVMFSWNLGDRRNDAKLNNNLFPFLTLFL